jgi:hypothetical protein
MVTPGATGESGTVGAEGNAVAGGVGGVPLFVVTGVEV